MTHPADGPFEVAIVGGGNMGAALAGGLLASGGVEPGDLAIVEVLGDRRDVLAGMFEGVAVHADVPPCRSAVLAVKPPDVPAAASAAVAAGAGRLLSIAAGVRLATIEAAAGPQVAVVRAMPNTPALVGLGASAIATGSAAGDDDVEWATSILGAVGIVEHLEEHQLDLFTGVAGSGPAYVFFLAEALIAAAVDEGLDAGTAERVVTQLLRGAAALLEQEGDPAALRAAVTSPGGTTAAGVAVLEERAVHDALRHTVRAATERSRELG